jgi:hypothetical protein
MTPVHSFEPGDFLIFQLEAGYGLLRVLGVEEKDGDAIWHVAAYSDLFLDPDTADAAIDNPEGLKVEIAHVALTNRAFESTQVAKLRNVPLADVALDSYRAWNNSPERQISDRSIRLLLGLR